MVYKRKTVDEYTICQHTMYGWEDLSAYDKRSEATTDLKLYRANQPEYTFRLFKKRVKVCNMIQLTA